MTSPFKFRINSLYSKLLLTFTITVTLLIFGLSALLYHNYSTASLSNIKRMNTSLLQQISFSMNYMDSLAHKFMSLANAEPLITNLFFNKGDDMFVIGDAFKALNRLVLTNDYVYSAYSVSLPLNRITSTENGAFYTAENFYDQEVVNLIRNWDKQSLSSVPIARRIPSPSSVSGFTNVYSYMIPFQAAQDELPQTALVVNIKASVLRGLIASLNTKTASFGSDIVVIDSNGTVVNHATEGLFLQNLRTEKYIETVLSSTQKSDSFETQIGGQSYNVTFVSSNEPKWKFISLTSYGTFMSPVEAVKSSTLFISMVVLLLGLLFSIFMSKSFYSPFRKLIETVRMKSNELDLKQRDHRQALRDKWLKELIMGNKDVGTIELQTKKVELGIRTNLMGPLQMILFRMDSYRSFLNSYNERDRSLLKFGIANIIEDISSSAKCTGDIIVMDADKLVLLLERAGTVEEETDLPLLVQNIQNAVKEYLRLSLSATISMPIESHSFLCDTYSDTLALSMYRLLVGKESILTPAFQASIQLSPPPFPEGKAKLLLDSLKLGHIDKVKKYYDEIISGLMGSTYENTMSSIMHLMFMIRSTFHSVADNGNSRLSSLVHTFFSSIDSFESIDEIHQTFETLFSEIVSTLDTNKQNKRNIIVDRIKKQIEEQYQDTNLNLNLLADEFQMSGAYLGRLFKELTGKSVVEYITDVRMARVKQLLDESNLSTKEILEQCGWEESNYFYILFKKHFGIPLSQYRLSKKNDDPGTPKAQF